MCRWNFYPSLLITGFERYKLWLDDNAKKYLNYNGKLDTTNHGLRDYVENCLKCDRIHLLGVFDSNGEHKGNVKITVTDKALGRVELSILLSQAASVKECTLVMS